MTHAPQADHRTNWLLAALVQMAGTASRIAVEHLDEVRSARPKLQRSIASHGEVLLGQTFQILTCNGTVGSRRMTRRRHRKG